MCAAQNQGQSPSLVFAFPRLSLNIHHEDTTFHYIITRTLQLYCTVPLISDRHFDSASKNITKEVMYFFLNQQFCNLKARKMIYLEKNKWNVLYTFRTVQKYMPLWHITYNTCNNASHIIIKNTLERDHITLAITL